MTTEVELWLALCFWIWLLAATRSVFRGPVVSCGERVLQTPRCWPWWENNPHLLMQRALVGLGVKILDGINAGSQFRTAVFRFYLTRAFAASEQACWDFLSLATLVIGSWCESQLPLSSCCGKWGQRSWLTLTFLGLSFCKTSSLSVSTQFRCPRSYIGPLLFLA